MKKTILTIIFFLAFSSSVWAAGLTRLEVTGTNVNVRAQANVKSAVMTKASKPDVFIAQDWIVTSDADKSQWYRLLFSVDKDGNLKDMREVIQDMAYPYISANFVSLSPLSENDQKQVAKLQGKTPNITPPGPKILTVNVSDEKGFLEALSSDTIIILKTGKYQLSKWDTTSDNIMQFTLDSNGQIDESKLPKLQSGVAWQYGELKLNGIKNLTIRGENKENKSELIVDPRDVFVMSFEACENVIIENIKAGHSEGGYCDGGVFSFENSSKISIKDTAMYGCGTEGLRISNTKDMTVTDSEIYECTYHIMTIRDSDNIAFQNCSFHHNEQFDMINVMGSLGVSFTSCKIADNNGKSIFSIDSPLYSFRKVVTEVLVSNCIFSDNNMERAIEDSKGVTFENCTFSSRDEISLNNLGWAILDDILSQRAVVPESDLYVNSRFGFSVAIPQEHFIFQQESENGDGRAFVSKRNNDVIVKASAGFAMFSIEETAEMYEPEGAKNTHISIDGEEFKTEYTLNEKYHVHIGAIRDKCQYTISFEVPDKDVFSEYRALFMDMIKSWRQVAGKHASVTIEKTIRMIEDSTLQFIVP